MKAQQGRYVETNFINDVTEIFHQNLQESNNEVLVAVNSAIESASYINTIKK